MTVRFNPNARVKPSYRIASLHYKHQKKERARKAALQYRLKTLAIAIVTSSITLLIVTLLNHD